MEKGNNIYISGKCSMCKSILEGDQIQTHTCFLTAQNIFLNENGDLVPQFEDIEDIEEILIAEVQKRRELWDHTLPISTRSREVIASHWEEISKQLNGVVTPFVASKKWRYLRDSYIRICNEQLKKKSGSAAAKPVKWKWYEHMRFLNDTQNFRRTTSNISSSEYSDCSSQSCSNEEQIKEHVGRPFKRHKKSESDNLLETISAIVKQPIKIVSSEPQSSQAEPENVPKKQDNINNILAIINNILHDMPEKEGFNFGLKLLHLTTEKENEFHNK